MKAGFDIDSFREVGQALVRNKSRSLLTGFGIFWGLFMLLALVGGGKGLKSKVMEEFAGFSNNAVVLISSNTSLPYKGFQEGRYWNLTMSDITRLKNLMPELDAVAGMIGQWGEVTYGNNVFNDASIKGVEAEYLKVETPQLKYGRYITAADDLQERKVCVIGKDIYKTLFPEGGDPCGKFICVGSIYMTVVGVDFNPGNLSINGSSSRAIMIPLSVARKIYNRGKNVDIICCAAKSSIKVGTLESRFRQVLSRYHQFSPDDTEAIMIINTEQIFNIVETLFRGINFLIWLVGIGTLIAGAVGVSNIMMVSVKERTTEIGIRRAIGALPGEILWQIISESIALTVLAGSISIMFSVLILQAVENGAKAPFQIGFWTAVVAMMMLAVLGAVAGLAPALRAMKIKPVEAMSEE